MSIKKRRVFAFFVAMVMMISTLSIQAFAQTTNERNEHRDSLEHGVYVTNRKEKIKEAKEADISTKNTAALYSNDIDDSTIIIVDFEELWESRELAMRIAEQIRCGRICYFRADGYTANRAIIANVLGIEDCAGYIRESSDIDVINRDGTFGYIVFMDDAGKLQMVRQLVSFVDYLIPISEYDESTTISAATSMQENSYSSASLRLEQAASKDTINFSFSDEMDAVDSFLDAYSPSKANRVIEVDDQGLSSQSTFSSYTYEVIYDTQYYYYYVRTSSDDTTTVKKLGAVTRSMYAERLYCATSGFSDISQVTSKWGYMTDVWMQPTWSQSTYYRSMNYNLAVSFYTFPQGVDNATYMMILRDYTPEVDLSGKTDVTLSVGANAAYSDGTELGGSAGLSATTSYDHVEITVPQWQTGKSYSYNVAGWNYRIGKTFTRLTTKPVAVSTIKLPAGVVLWNYSTTYSCIQLNFEATWYVNQGTFNTNDGIAVASGAVAWRPANLY